MGNPGLRSDPFEAGPRPPTANGDLGKIGGDFIGQGSQKLPPPGPEHGEGCRREVMLSGVPKFGLVRMTYENRSYRHGRSKHWRWGVVRAEAVTLGLPVVIYPKWVDDFWWPAGC